MSGHLATQEFAHVALLFAAIDSMGCIEQPAFIQYIGLMSYLVFYILGFSTLWAGLKLFDDEVFLLVTLITGSGLVLVGLFSSPVKLQVGIEVALIASLFHICMECIERGGRA